MLAELESDWPSAATSELTAQPELSDEEIAERMSGNICRCGAYPGIVAAIRQAAP
jgi:xanthine dehydrogenase YagT iron-sulfur-binding subunit